MLKKALLILMQWFCLEGMLIACSSGTPLPEPQSIGARTYQVNCGMCHSLPHPGRHTFPQWQHMMEVMQEHRINRGMPELNTKDHTIIMEYLNRHAR